MAHERITIEELITLEQNAMSAESGDVKANVEAFFDKWHAARPTTRKAVRVLNSTGAKPKSAVSK